MLVCKFEVADFEVSHLLSVVLSSLVPRLCRPTECLRFANYFENNFLFFRKSLKILWPQLLFVKGTYWKYDQKKSKHVLSLTISRYQEIKCMRKLVWKLY